ncbi:hypothetical protein, partial [Laceyella putida]
FIDSTKKAADPAFQGSLSAASALALRQVLFVVRTAIAHSLGSHLSSGGSGLSVGQGRPIEWFRMKGALEAERNLAVKGECECTYKQEANDV